MKIPLILAASLLAISPLSAQNFEVGLFAGQQTYKSPGYSFTNTTPSGSVSYSTESATVVAARFGYTVLGFGPASLQLTAAYQPKVSAQQTYTNTATQTTEVVNSKAGYYAAGAMLRMRAPLDLGAGLEYRFEGANVRYGDSTYQRPWARLHAGFSIPAPVVKPFVVLEFAFPLTSTSLGAGDATSNNDKLAKASGPKAQVGIYAGIRF